MCMVHVLGASNHTPTPTHIIQFVGFTYCHDIFPEQALTHTHTKYEPLISNIQNK